MDRIITYSFQDNFIRKLTGFIEENFFGPSRDLSRLALVFGGKRPALFVKQELFRRVDGSFFPPVFFSMDEFVEYIVAKKRTFARISDIDACDLIYRLTGKISPEMLKGRAEFSRFLPWGREILAFIEQLDLEDIKPEALKGVQFNAAIGYEVPENINALLTHIIALREVYHAALEERAVLARGLTYLSAARTIEEINFDEFDHILFCNPFYLHQTEKVILGSIFDRGQALLFFQGDEREWPVLQEAARTFSCRIEPKEKKRNACRLELYSGFDTQSQIGLAREALRKIKRPGQTVIVLPEPESLIPLLSEIAAGSDVNVSLGYPLKRSSLHALLQLVFSAQRTGKDGRYYTSDYLRVLRHPLVKNLSISGETAVTRVLIHKIEEVLLGMVENPLAGSLFIRLEDIRTSKHLYEDALAALGAMEMIVGYEQLQGVVEELHKLLFTSWEEIATLEKFCAGLENLLNRMVEKAPLKSYPLNLKIVDRLFALSVRLRSATCSREEFSREEIFRIAEDTLENEVIPFTGSPLRGLQILGLFETRSLNFENVIFVDVNETVLPRMRIYEPLIPREVMLGLGLNRLEKEEEIQRYQFMRLIAAARNVCLIYEESKDKEKSRFIEELLWNRQKDSGSLEVVSVPRARFEVRVLPPKAKVEKRTEVVEFLSFREYSATSVDTYLRCPLRFYYQYVLGLKEKERLPEDPEGVEVGSFVHGLLEETFRRFLNRRPEIDEKFRKYFFRRLEERFADEFEKRMKADAFLLKETLKFRMDRFLNAEKEREIKEILALEQSLEQRLKFSGKYFNFTARIDRIDCLPDGSALIIDYKTGSINPRPKSISKLKAMDFSRGAIKDTVRSFQLPLYLYLARKKKIKSKKLNAALYNLRTAKLDYLLKPEDFSRKEEIVDICLRALQFLLGEILNPGVGFEADNQDGHYCRNCPFFYLCR